MRCGLRENCLLRSAQQLEAKIAAAELCAVRGVGANMRSGDSCGRARSKCRCAEMDLLSGQRAAARCCAFLWRESCADELTCDRPGSPTTTLRKFQITMMMMHDARAMMLPLTLMCSALMTMTMQL